MKTDVYEKEATTTTDRPEPGPIGSGSSKPDADKAEMMKKVEAAGKPGPGHQALNALVGDWKAEVKCWMDPGGSPEVSQGTAQCKLEVQWPFSGGGVPRPNDGQAVHRADSVGLRQHEADIQQRVDE